MNTKLNQGAESTDS